MTRSAFVYRTFTKTIKDHYRLISSGYCDQKWLKPPGFDTRIHIYNSVSKTKVPLILMNDKIAYWYSCGPTVYDHAHIGHASSYVRLDTIRRILENFFNINCIFVLGITNIDDKIIKRAHDENKDFMEIVSYYEKMFLEDMDSLNVLRPTLCTRVTDYVQHIIDFIKIIVNKEFAYVTETGSVYFDVNRYGRYGRLYQSSSTISNEPFDAGKRNDKDFVLWKGAKPNEPVWNSPWGPGRPGWHIECSTMSSAIFGHHLDIHSGGMDLMFPHHENEIAQSEACFGCQQWTNYWIHTGHLYSKNSTEKMSKSLKNTVSIPELLGKYTASQFRVFCLLRHYRKQIEFDEKGMQHACDVLNRWKSCMSSCDNFIKSQSKLTTENSDKLLLVLKNCKEEIIEALADDFDTPVVILAIEKLIHATNIGLKSNLDINDTRNHLGTIISITMFLEQTLSKLGISSVLDVPNQGSLFNEVVDEMVSFRNRIRHFALNAKVLSQEPLSKSSLNITNKELKRLRIGQYGPLLDICDDVRNQLIDKGVAIKDHGEKSSWELIEKPI